MIEPYHRLFFALWPSDLIKQRIQVALPRHIANVPEEKWHITLRFLGRCNPQQRQCLLRQKAFAIHRFSLTLDKLGYWSRNKITWLGSSQQSASLNLLVQELDQRILSCGFDLRKAGSFVPHLTLARRHKPKGKLNLEESIHWPVQGISLMESITQAGRYEYREIAQWPFLR